MKLKTADFARVVLIGLLSSISLAVRAACIFESPKGWNVSNVRWEGECVNGKANGLGILKEYKGDKVLRVYFGQVNAGALNVGVIDQEGGYTAGRFENGRLLNSDDRQNFIDAFSVAEKAANSVASRFEQARNEASAKFYRQKAKDLREQMD